MPLCQRSSPARSWSPLPGASLGSRCRSCAALDAGLVSCFYSGREQLSSASCLCLAAFPTAQPLPRLALLRPRRGQHGRDPLGAPRAGQGRPRPRSSPLEQEGLQGGQLWPGVLGVLCALLLTSQCCHGPWSPPGRVSPCSPGSSGCGPGKSGFQFLSAAAWAHCTPFKRCGSLL